MLDVMDDLQREPRVAEDSATEQESRSEATSVAPVARLLANPRRVRRD
jgi:hypothetical protein